MILELKSYIENKTETEQNMKKLWLHIGIEPRTYNAAG